MLRHLAPTAPDDEEAMRIAAHRVGTSLTPNHHFADYRSHHPAAKFSHDIAIGGRHEWLDPEFRVSRTGIDRHAVLRPDRAGRSACRCTARRDDIAAA